MTQIGYMDTEIYFPVVDVNIDLHWFYYPFLFLVIAGTANGVEPHRRARRAVVGGRDDLAPHPARDRRDHVDPLQSPSRRCAATSTSTWRSSRRR